MSDFLRIFLNARSLKAITRELTLEQLSEGFTSIVEELRVQEVSVRKSQEARLHKIAEYKELLKSEGIDLADLLTGSVYTEKNKQTRTTLC